MKLLLEIIIAIWVPFAAQLPHIHRVLDHRAEEMCFSVSLNSIDLYLIYYKLIIF